MLRRFVLPRLAQLVVLFLLVAVLGFLLLRAAPGDPARTLAGLTASPAQVAAERTALGLDRPLGAQLLTWLGRLFSGDLGISYIDQQPVVRILGQAAPPTVQLTVVALVLTVLVGVPLGVRSALRPGGFVDGGARGYALVGIAVPGFVAGLLLVLVFGWWWPHGLPYQGYVSILSDPWQGLRHTVLPSLCLALAPIAVVARQTRTAMVEVLGRQHVVAARALGVPEREIIRTDALLPALMPILTVVGLLLGLVLSSTVVVENVFAVPGLGREIVGAFTDRDYPVAIGALLFFALAFLVINLVTDLVYAVVNPRVRRGYAA